MKLLSSLLLVIFTLIDSRHGYGQSTQTSSTDTNDAIARIRDEGMNHSQVMETLSTLTEVIGPRLTGSPNLKRANEWTRDQLKCFGLPMRTSRPGALRARVVAQTIFSASSRAADHSPHRLSECLVSRFGKAADGGGLCISRAGRMTWKNSKANWKAKSC